MIRAPDKSNKQDSNQQKTSIKQEENNYGLQEE